VEYKNLDVLVVIKYSGTNRYSFKKSYGEHLLV